MKNSFNTSSKIILAINLTKELILLISIIIVFFVVMNIWGHEKNTAVWAGTLVVFSILKIYYLVMHTFKKLDTLIEYNHAFNHLLLLFGAIITIIIFSFTMDYLCVTEIYVDAFSGIQQSQSMALRFINLLYFSIVTFTTVGYGDITPVAPVAKLITVFEMISAFVMIVFVFSKYFRNNSEK